jgi:glucose-1-phosphate adenylyltransferase
MDNILAVILAGGQGKRMGKLCLHRPKPALPIAGNYRVIDFALSNCLLSGIDSVAVLTDYRRSYLASYLRQWDREQKYNNNFNIYILEAENHYLGTADALYQNLEYLREKHINTIVVLAADHIYKMDYRKMIAFHKTNQADVTVGVVPMSPENARRFGTATVDKTNRILDFVEKSDIPQNNLVSMGIYVFSVEPLVERLSNDANNPGSAHDFGYSVIPEMVKMDRAYAYQFDDYWRDIGTIESYYESSLELANHACPFSFDGTWPIVTSQSNDKQNRSHSEGNIINSVISPGCVIKGKVENSVISPGVWVAENAVVRNSVLMGNVFIGPDTQVENAIIDEEVSVGRSSSIGAKDQQIISAANITIIKKGQIVPPYTNLKPQDDDLGLTDISKVITSLKELDLSYALAK